MPTRLIVNADDFGLTRGINRAVEELHQAHALTSATLMATGPAFDDAAAIARRNPTLGVGCHLMFVDGLPVSHPDDIPTLLGADGKTFRPNLLDFLQALLRGTINPDEIARETQAQIQTIQRAGIDVTHIDSHKHTHLFPQLARPVLYAAQRCGVRAFRYPTEPRWARSLDSTSIPWSRRAAQLLFDLFTPSFRRLIDFTTDEKTTAGTLGIAATGTLNARSLTTLLHAIPTHGPDQLYELCCHPGYDDADLAQVRTRLRASRELERQALLQVIPELSRTGDGPTLIHYGNLGIPGAQRAAGHYISPTGCETAL